MTSYHSSVPAFEMQSGPEAAEALSAVKPLTADYCGISKSCPTKIRLGLAMWLSAAMALTVVSKRSARADRVSPGMTR